LVQDTIQDRWSLLLDLSSETCKPVGFGSLVINRRISKSFVAVLTTSFERKGLWRDKEREREREGEGAQHVSRRTKKYLEIRSEIQPDIGVNFRSFATISERELDGSYVSAHKERIK